MDAATIDILSSHNPESQLSPIPLGRLLSESRRAPLHSVAKDRFLSKYVRTNFGWYISLLFANHGMPFPHVLTGRDTWVFKSYLMRIDPVKHYDHNIAEAFHLNQVIQGRPNLAQHLKALMMAYSGIVSPEAYIGQIAEMTGIEHDTVDAFEILFFNILDRRKDAIYLAAEVYPDTRLVEFDENYLENSTHADLLRRVAYNHRDMDLSSYLAGIGDHSYLRKLAASDDREAELTRYLMGNGLILAHSSLLNQKSIGMGRVSNLLAASRQGGKDQEEPTVGGISQLYSGAFAKAIEANQNMVFAQTREDAGAPPPSDAIDVVEVD